MADEKLADLDRQAVDAPVDCLATTPSPGGRQSMARSFSGPHLGNDVGVSL